MEHVKAQVMNKEETHDGNLDEVIHRLENVQELWERMREVAKQGTLEMLHQSPFIAEAVTDVLWPAKKFYWSNLEPVCDQSQLTKICELIHPVVQDSTPPWA